MGPRSPRGNLPAELSSFVGRHSEVEEIGRLVAHSRLVTLTGPGGVGKSRLAGQVARHVRQAFPDGVWWVDLASLTDPELLASTVAAALGAADRFVTDSLPHLLQDKRLLVVLDTCTHLSDPCAVLVGRVLPGAPEVRVLATSLQPLRAEGERLVRVAPLPVPDPGHLPPAAELGAFAGVRLFVERARAVLPDFRVTSDNAAAVAGVCARLDGLPLAIELAAARLRVLSVQQVLERLDDRFHLLTRGARTAPARQQTLRATFDWSHALCSPAEQALWARASVFAGGFDLDAAEQVCGGDGIAAHDVFDLVAALVDRSILVRDPRADAPARYDMLESVRQYGHERLAAAGRQDAQRRRHREHYQRLALQAGSEFFSPRQVEWMLRNQREHLNLRAALESFLTEPGGAGQALEMLGALRNYWISLGQHREALVWLRRGLALDSRPTRTRAAALGYAAYTSCVVDDVETGRRLLAEARDLAQRTGDPYTRATVTFDAGLVAMHEHPPDLDRARTLAEQALAEFERHGAPCEISMGLWQVGSLTALQGRPDAIDYLVRNLALCEAHGAEFSRAWVLAMLGLARWQHGEHARAAADLHEALRIRQLIPDPWGTRICLLVEACLAGHAGRHERAARLLGACQALKGISGWTLADRDIFQEQQAACEHEARRVLGAAAYAAALEQGTRMTLAEAIGYALDERPADERPAPAPAGTGTGPLTGRQYEIAGLVAEGLSNAEIATRLAISRRTVESHVSHVLAVLGLANRAQIAAWAAGGGARGAPEGGERA